MTTALNIEPKTLQCIDATQAWQYHIVPLEVGEGHLRVLADTKHFDQAMKDELEFIKNKTILVEEASGEFVAELLHKHYRKKEGIHSGDVVRVNVDQTDTFVDDLVKEAKDLGSSDIHIETFEGEGRVRIRIDGKLFRKYHINKTDYPSLVNKLKIQANLDIGEKRLPQDGRIHFKGHQDKFDIRVSVLPTLYGEKVVMRILNQDTSRLDIERIGLSADQKTQYLNAIRKPDGIILISGPTGSGKTTTLYATLKELNAPEVNISTVEDPIEYTLEGVNQAQVKDAIGFGFADALRSLLRQDPDILMIGEIRDSETAQMAIRASLTGHLVLSTIHTNSAVDTIYRLMDMGIPPYLIASTLHLSVAQRLVRLLCVHCRTTEEIVWSSMPKSMERIKETCPSHSRPVGCEKCHYTGYKGRMALYEVLSINESIKQKIRTVGNVHEALPEHHCSLQDAALRLFENGATSLEEIYPILQ